MGLGCVALGLEKCKGNWNGVGLWRWAVLRVEHGRWSGVGEGWGGGWVCGEAFVGGALGLEGVALGLKKCMGS